VLGLIILYLTKVQVSFIPPEPPRPNDD
jgi:hypothetical protein